MVDKSYVDEMLNPGGKERAKQAELKREDKIIAERNVKAAAARERRVVIESARSQVKSQSGALKHMRVSAIKSKIGAGLESILYGSTGKGKKAGKITKRMPAITKELIRKTEKVGTPEALALANKLKQIEFQQRKLSKGVKPGKAFKGIPGRMQFKFAEKKLFPKPDIRGMKYVTELEAAQRIAAEAVRGKNMLDRQSVFNKPSVFSSPNQTNPNQAQQPNNSISPQNPRNVLDAGSVGFFGGGSSSESILKRRNSFFLK